MAGDKATDLDQLGRFLFNFSNPTTIRRGPDRRSRSDRSTLSEPLEQQLLAKARLELLVVHALLDGVALRPASVFSDSALPGSPTLPGDRPEQTGTVEPLIYHSATGT